MEAAGVVEQVVEKENTEEEFFFKLFYEVFELIKPKSVTADDIRDAIERIRVHFSEIGPKGAYDIEKFSTPADTLGGFYWHSPLSAGVARNKTLDALRHCAEFRSRFDRPSLKLVSVGGGTGSDLVGLYSSLNEEKCGFQSMGVTLIDFNKSWKPYGKMIESCLRQHDFGNASELIGKKGIEISFLEADLRNEEELESDQEICKALRDADIFWVSGILTILQDDSDREKLTRNIVPFMKKGALWVIIDSLAYDRFEKFQELKKVYMTKVDHNYKFPLDPDKYHMRKSTNHEIIIYKKV